MVTETRAEWLKSLCAGVEVIFTNIVYPHFSDTSNITEREVPPFIRKTVIREITGNRIITADGNVFTEEGIHVNAFSIFGGCIVPATDRMRLIVNQYNMAQSMACLEWSKVPMETMNKILKILRETESIDSFENSTLPNDVGRTFTEVSLRIPYLRLTSSAEIIQPEIQESRKHDDFSDYDETFEKFFGHLHSNNVTYSRGAHKSKKGSKRNEKKM